MKQLAIFVGLLLAAAPARAQSKNIHENVDPYTGLRTLFTEVATRTCPGDPSPGPHDPEVHLLFTAMQNPDDTLSYLLSPELDGASYTLSLRASATMDTLIDGTEGRFRRCVKPEQLKNLSAFIGLAARYEPSHMATSVDPR